jgi:hypothetical protein
MRFYSLLNYTQYSHVHFKWALARERGRHILENTKPPPYLNVHVRGQATKAGSLWALTETTCKLYKNNS